MYNIQISEFQDGRITLSNKNYIKILKEFLCQWSNKDWEIIIDNNKGEVLETKIIQNFKESNFWKSINEIFPKAQIGNIILKE